MRAKYTGDGPIIDPRTANMGIVRGGEYNISLERADWWTRWIYKARLQLYVQVTGRWIFIPYRSMETFEANWQVK
jgi:hypothetical protein